MSIILIRRTTTIAKTDQKDEKLVESWPTLCQWLKNWEIRNEIRTDTFYLLPYDFWRPDGDLIRFKKWDQCNESGFCFSASPSSTKS